MNLRIRSKINKNIKIIYILKYNVTVILQLYFRTQSYTIMNRDGYRLHFIDTDTALSIPVLIDTIWCKKMCEKLLRISNYFITAEL